MVTPESIAIGLGSILLSLVGFLMVRTLRQVDETMKAFHSRLTAVELNQARAAGFDSGFKAGQVARGIVAVLLLWLVVGGSVQAQTPTPATFNPVPVQNASFLTVLRTFLYGEDADRSAAQFFPMVVAGCIHPTAAGTTGTFSTNCLAFTDGAYIIEPAATINYTTQGAAATDYCWVTLTPLTNTTTGGWTRVAGTHYMTDCTTAAGTRPGIQPASSTMLMGVTLTGGAISDVDQMFAENANLRTYTNTSEIDTVRPGSWWMQDFTSATGPLCYIDNAGACQPVPLGTAGGCALCGDSAASFFTVGELEATRGGTGQNSAAWVGVVKVGPTPGTWKVEDFVTPEEGGFGEDVSACEASGGVVYWTTGSVLACSFPALRWDLNAFDLSPDSAQCTRSESQVLVTGVQADVIECADNTAGRIFATFRLPATYETGAVFSLRLVGVNTAASSGIVGFDASCMCATDTSGGSVLNAANYGTADNLDLTWTGSAGQIVSSSTTVTCGGTCTANKSISVRLSLDATATTLSPSDTAKFTLLVAQTAGDGL